MEKKYELSEPNSCLNNSDDDEPLFVLCARDETSTLHVANWIVEAIRRDVNKRKLADAARSLASMFEWQERYDTKLPD